MNLIARIHRLFLLHKWLRDYEKSLNRRAEVENYLIRASKGKEPLPDEKKCRELAAKLGCPPAPNPHP